MSSGREIKAGVGYTIGNIFIKGMVFISLPIFSRLLTTEQFGIYNTYMAYEAILAILLGLGMYSSIKNAKIDYPDKVDVYVSTLLKITLIPLISAILCAVFAGSLFSDFLGLNRSILLLLIFQSYGSAMLSISNSRLSLDYNYKKYLGFAAFNTILNVGLSLVLILFIFSDQREFGRIVGSAVPLIIIGIYVFAYYTRKGGNRFEGSMAKYGLSIGLPLIWHYLSQQIQNQFDRIAITKIVGASATGIYSFAYTVANILQVMFYSTENVWSVWMYDQMSKRNYTAIREASKKYILLISSIAILMLVGSREVILIMGDKEYWEGATIFIPILIGIYLLFLYTIPAGIEYYYKKTKYIAIMTAIAAFVNITLNFALIPCFGYIIAAYTTMLSYAVQFAAHWIISDRVLKNEGAPKIYYISDLMKMFFIVCLAGVAVNYLNPYPVFKYALFTVFFGVLAYVRRDDVRTLILMLRKRKNT